MEKIKLNRYPMLLEDAASLMDLIRTDEIHRPVILKMISAAYEQGKEDGFDAGMRSKVPSVQDQLTGEMRYKIYMDGERLTIAFEEQASFISFTKLEFAWFRQEVIKLLYNGSEELF